MEVDLSQLLANYTGKAQKKVEKYAQEEKTWYYVEVILTLFTISFFAIFAIRPAVVTISGLVGEINRKQELSERMGQKINTVIVAQEQYALVQENWQLLASFLPSEFDFPEAIAQVAGSAQENNLNINSLGFSNMGFVNQKVIEKSQPETLAEIDNDQLEALAFSFRSKSELEALKTFLTRLPQSRRWTKIDSYQMSKSGSDDEEEGQRGINLSINGYWLFWRDKK
jgi:hypothetical protein